ncbi:DUF4956 domain-containing protein [Patescibacteria group bacterium]
MFSPENFFNLTSIELSSTIIVFNILFSFVLVFFIAWIYKRTHSGISYSSSFVFTIVLMGVVSTVIMMVVSHNLIGAVGLLGAFSLLRFRTIIKDTRDIAFVFFSLAIGVAVGTNNYTIALLATILVSLIIIFLTKIRFGSALKEDFVLTFNLPGGSSNVYSKVFSNFFKSHELLHVKSFGEDRQEYAFSFILQKDKILDDFLKELKVINDIAGVEIISINSSVEY